MPKPLEHAGKQYTNADAWRTAKATIPAKGPAIGPSMAEPEEQGQMQPHQEAIHEHLRAMHEQTGGAHSHVEHHEGGAYTSHHVSKGGEVNGPHEHANLEELKSAFDRFIDEEGAERDEPEQA